jgi:hypothetical protein
MLSLIRQSDERKDMTMIAKFGIDITAQHHHTTSAQYDPKYSKAKNNTA